MLALRLHRIGDLTGALHRGAEGVEALVQGAETTEGSGEGLVPVDFGKGDDGLGKCRAKGLGISRGPNQERNAFGGNGLRGDELGDRVGEDGGVFLRQREDAREGVVRLDPVPAHFLDEESGLLRRGGVQGGLERGEDFVRFGPLQGLVVRAAGVGTSAPAVSGPLSLALGEAAEGGEEELADLRALFGGEFGKEFVDDAGDIMHAHQGEGGTFGIRATQERFDRGVLRAEPGEGLESGVGDARIGIGEERSDGGSCVLHALACRGDGGFAAGPRIGAFRGIGDPGCGQRSEIASRT